MKMKNASLHLTAVVSTAVAIIIIIIMSVFFYVGGGHPKQLQSNPILSVDTTKSRHGSRLLIERGKLIQDAQTDERVCGTVFFTSDGEAFLWPDTKQDDCRYTIWRDSNSGWYASPEKMFEDTQRTGYLRIPDDAVSVTLQ